MEEEKVKITTNLDFDSEELEKIFEIVERLKKVEDELDELENEIDSRESEISELEIELENENENDNETMNMKKEYETMKKELEELKVKYDIKKREQEELEKQLLQMLEIDYETNISYFSNYNYIYPTIVIPTDMDYVFWIELSPRITIYISKSK